MNGGGQKLTNTEISPFRNKVLLAPIEVLKVCNRYFVYDSGINQIFEVDHTTANALEHYSSCEADDLCNIQNEEPETLGQKKVQERIDLFNRIRSEGNVVRPYRLQFKDSPTIKIIPKTVEFVITGGCNLKCRYCATRDRYVSFEGTLDIMSEEIALKAVSFVKRFYDKGPLLIKFFGGETLLGKDIIRKVIYAFKEHGIESEKMIATNGLLLDEETINFLAEHRFLTFISLDGPPEIHDAYRKDKLGHGTYSKVVDKLRLIQKLQPDFFRSYVAINMVVTPEFSGKYNELVSHLTNLGISHDQIHPSDTQQTSDNCTSYSITQASNVHQEKSRIRKEMIDNALHNQDWKRNKSHESYCQFYIEALKMNEECYRDELDGEDEGIINLIDCQSGSWNILTIWPDGKVSACIEFNRRKDLVFGDLVTGETNLEKISAFKSKFRQSVVEGKCATCWAVRYCSYTGCYRYFAKNFCDPLWQQSSICDGIKDDIHERLKDFLRFKIETSKIQKEVNKDGNN